MITKRLFALGIAGVMLFSMAACGGSTSGETGSGGETSGGGSDTQVSQVSDSSDSSGTLAESAGPNTVKSEETLVVSMASEPATLWTAGSGTQDNQCLIIQNCMQDRLVTYDKENNEVLPSLATSWEWLDDYRIQFTLRDDVTMSDGTPFEAEDVLYTVQTAAEYSSTIDCGKYYDVENCEVVDDHTFIMALNVIAPDFITMLAEAQYGIVSEGDVEAAGGVEAAARNPVIGVGKYKFKEWVNGQYILLERNEDYWDDSYAGYYKEIRFTFTNDAATREMAVESGDANMALEIPANIAATFLENEAVQTQLYTTQNVMHLFFNCSEGPCADMAVREAISYALDVNALNQVGTSGLGQVSNGWFMPGGTYYVDVYDGQERVQDTAKAQQILADAGYGDGLTLSTIVQQNNASVLTVIQEQLRLAGITLEISTLDTAQYVSEARAGNFDIIMVGSAVETRTPTLFTFYQKDMCENVIGGSRFTTDELDSMISQMIQTSDESQAKELSEQIIRTIKDNYYAVDLFTEYKAVILSKDISGFKTLERGYPDCTALYVAQ